MSGVDDLVRWLRVRLDFVLRCLAMPYADRPGHREEWRP